MSNQISSRSLRAAILTRRTYNRPLNAEGTLFETWPMTLDRVISHQTWLWERAQGDKLSTKQKAELAELRELMLNCMVAPAGRTLWLGGTEIVKRREASNFNCAFLEVRTIHDLVDAGWLLMQGCGVGFKPVSGALSGYPRRMEVEIIRSTRTTKGGQEHNTERFDPASKVWTIVVGDSAEAWAKAIGKIIAGKFPAKKLKIDLSQIRPPGGRLSGYGWICSGCEPFAIALTNICEIMNRKAGKLLSKIDILDIINWIGTILSSRRSAEIALMDYGDAEWSEFAAAKTPAKLKKLWHRSQSNNSLVFKEKPTLKQLKDVFDMIVSNGGSEPGIVNFEQAQARAPWVKGMNPCGEILLADRGFCNLCELDLAKFKDDHQGMHRAMRLIARANYRQTIVNLRDGILQDAWHQTNESLRLCGTGITGIIRRPDMTPYDFRRLRYTAIAGAYEMADELDLERPANVTTIKPSGTVSKIMSTTEGAHKPLAKYIFNNVIFSRHDPLVNRLAEANYHIFDHPFDNTSVLIRLPVSYEDVSFDMYNGHEVNREGAISQLERYRMLQNNYVDQNCSITVSYGVDEVKNMVAWFDKNWNSYVATSFLFRNDVTKTAEDLGYAYLPQEVVTKKSFDDYNSKLKPVDIDDIGCADTPIEQECEGGACPVR